MRNVITRIKTFNENRIPEILALKYKAMRENAFRFYRGTCHLFYHDLPAQSPLLKSPMAWVCGDMHLENFGSYKGDNRLAYFDINDFDESALAPCLVDAGRLMCSLLLATSALGINQKEAKHLFHIFLDEYAATLSAGYIRPLEQETAKGVVKDLLDTVQLRKQKDFLTKRVVYKNGASKLIIDNLRTFKVDKASRQEVKTAIDQWRTKMKDPSFYEVLDVAYRVAGTGSLGLDRYIVLVAGKATTGPFLLDVKLASPSCILTYYDFPQPQWPNEAARIIELQKRIQATSPYLLSDIRVDGKHFVLKELQPMLDKLNYDLFRGKIRKLEMVLKTMGHICAWDCLRSSGRQGSAIADELIDFGKQVAQWNSGVFDFAQQYSVQVKNDYKVFCNAYDEGQFSRKHAVAK
jgi:uncharacterized protein (DUF2252 family)